jgi:hypothetical protein
MSINQNNQNKTKNDLRQLLVQNLDKLINDKLLNEGQIQTGGGKKYTQSELDNLTQQTIQYIGALFFQSQSDKSIIRNQIESLLKQKPYLFDMMSKLDYDMKTFEYVYKNQSQYGGSGKKYSQQQLDMAINNSVQQFLAQYIQSESEKQKLSNVYAKLVELSEINPFVQFGHAVNVSNLVNVANSNSITNKVATHISLKTLIDYLSDPSNNLYKFGDPNINIKLLSNANYELSYNIANNYSIKLLVNPQPDKAKLNTELKNIFKFKSTDPVTNSKKANDIIANNELNDGVKRFLNELKFINLDAEKIKVNPANPLQGIIEDSNITVGSGKGKKTDKITNFIKSNNQIKQAYELINQRISNIITNGGLTKTLS